MAKKILVADDEPNILSLVVVRLEDEGYQVISACDGDEAVDRAVGHLPDLMILDYEMPGLRGIEAYERMRQIKPELARTPVIFLTAYCSEELRNELLSRGAADIIDKPFKAPDLLQMVKHILKG